MMFTSVEVAVLFIILFTSDGSYADTLFRNSSFGDDRAEQGLCTTEVGNAPRLMKRKNTDNQALLMGENAFHCEAVLTDWEYYRTDENITAFAAVWRVDGNGVYVLTAKTTLPPAELGYNRVSVYPPIKVRPGYFIGSHLSNTAPHSPISLEYYYFDGPSVLVNESHRTIIAPGLYDEDLSVGKEWVSQPFSKQYHYVLSVALRAKIKTESDNIALRGTAIQSSEFYLKGSTFNGGTADRAIDGNTDQVWYTHRYGFVSRCVLTQAAQYQPWWQLDLGRVDTVSAVEILNRAEKCCVFELWRFEVRVGNNGHRAFSSDTLCDRVEGTVTDTALIPCKTSPIRGQYVTIQLHVLQGQISFCEVKVYRTVPENPVDICSWTHLPLRFTNGYDKRTYRDMTLIECRRTCLKETAFKCRSVDYMQSDNKCFLSDVTIATYPHDLTDTRKSYHEPACYKSCSGKECGNGVYNSFSYCETTSNCSFIRVPADVPTSLYNERYHEAIYKTWIIQAPESYGIDFKIIQMDTDESCRNSFVEIYNSSFLEASALLRKACGFITGQSPIRIKQKRRHLLISYKANLMVYKADFYAEFSHFFTGRKGVSRCKENWIEYGPSCYLFQKSPMPISWFEAEKQCAKLDGHLVSINNEAEMTFIHYELIRLGWTSYKRTFIGLTDQDTEGHFYWSDGAAMVYSSWYIRVENQHLSWRYPLNRTQPDGNKLENCVLIEIGGNYSSLRTWHDVACVINSVYRYICEITEVKGNANLAAPIIRRDEAGKCGSTLHTCENGECILTTRVCDDVRDCQDGSDEWNCESLAISERSFACGSGELIDISLYCDTERHCVDGSDEQNCVQRNCSDREFRCTNGQCVPASSRCDLWPHCRDGSDESGCTENCAKSWTFQCFDGRCIPISAVCDGMTDCAGVAGEDEIFHCENATSCRDSEFQCKNGYCIPSAGRCIYDINQYGFVAGCRDASHLQDCAGVECPLYHMKCRDSYCLPARRRCDGRRDCPHGDDEMDCGSYSCEGFYVCAGEEHSCLPLSQRCDGVYQCKHGDDEKFCDNHCPADCACAGDHVDCSSVNLPSMPNGLSKEIRKLNLAGTLMNLMEGNLLEYHFLAELNLAHNNLKKLHGKMFRSQKNLYLLNLSMNALTRLEKDVFMGLINLQILDLSQNQLYSAEDETFLYLNRLIYLNLANNRITEFTRSLFQGLQSMEKLHTDDYKFCCIAELVPGGECLPLADAFSSCDDLLANSALRVCVWLIGAVALTGNSAVITWRLIGQRKLTVNDFFIINLAVADLLMGVYMGIIASVDVHYRGIYVENAARWKNGAFCQFSGFLSTLSSEMSVCMLMLITTDRLIAILFPFGSHRFNMKRAKFACVTSWLITVLLSAIPLVPSEFFRGQFYARSPVCLSLHITTEIYPGWQYSVALYFGLNLVVLLYIFIAYSVIYSKVRETAERVRSSKTKTDGAVVRKMALIICTDLCCWFPIVIMGLSAAAGVHIPNNVYAWTAVFILPINSAINPFLYTLSAVHSKRKKRAKQSRLNSRSKMEMSNTQTDLLFTSSRKLRTIPLSIYICERALDVGQLLAVCRALCELIYSLHERHFTCYSIDMRSFMITEQENHDVTIYATSPIVQIPPRGMIHVTSDNMADVGKLLSKCLQMWMTKRRGGQY